MPAHLRLVAASLAALVTVAPGLGVRPARATTWSVPSGVPTLAAALDSAVSGDTVELDCGTFFAHDLGVPAGVTVRGITGDPACVTVDGAYLGRIFECAGVDGVRFEGLTLTHGAATAGAFFDRSGGALRCDSSDVTLADCVLRGNRAAFGAGLAARGTTLTLTGCVFEADSASSGTAWAAGGGIWAQGCSGSVVGCAFTRNAAFGASPPGDGGAVFADESALVFEDCTFAENAAGAGAGALYSFSRDFTSLQRCTFTANTAPAGGALYVENSYPTLTACAFVANTAANGGAAFFGERSRPSLFDCTFEGDSAFPNSGGAIDCWQSDPAIVRTTFRRPSAAGRGGAFAAHGTSRFTFDACLIDSATAGTGGGAIFAEDTAVGTLTGCTVRATTTSGAAAAALAATESSSLSLARGLVAFSLAGAATSCSGAGAVTASCTDLFGNAGGDWTGCVAGQAGASGNFSADPQFCAAADDGSVTLPDSPCLPAGNACGVTVGVAGGGCGCPSGATMLVPGDYPTINAALAAAVPGDVVGVCSGEWTGPVNVRSGVHLLGVRADLARIVPDSGAPTSAVLRAAHVADSTVVAGLGLDGRGLVPQVVLAESTSIGLRFARDTITGGASWGIVNGPDSHVTLGGSLADACDLFGNGGVPAHHVRNDNATADSLDATHVWWGTQDYPAILASVQGRVRTCPITNAAHDAALCAPLAAVDVPDARPGAGPLLSLAPNPARGDVRMSFAAPPGRPVRVRIHDVAGRRLRTLVTTAPGEGRAAMSWDGRDDAGRPAPAGVYFVRLDTTAGAVTRKLVLLR